MVSLVVLWVPVVEEVEVVAVDVVVVVLVVPEELVVPAELVELVGLVDVVDVVPFPCCPNPPSVPELLGSSSLDREGGGRPDSSSVVL